MVEKLLDKHKEIYRNNWNQFVSQWTDKDLCIQFSYDTIKYIINEFREKNGLISWSFDANPENNMITRIRLKTMNYDNHVVEWVIDMCFTGLTLE